MTGPQGRKLPGPGAPLTAERDRYLRLMAQGMSNSQACREVGVDRRTGTRWRYGRDMVDSGGRVRHYAPIATRPVVESPRFLSQDERVRIADLIHAGATIRSVATQMGRSPSTISRELRRNVNDTGQYQPFAAHRSALSRRTRSGPGKLAKDPVLRAHVQARLEQRWSPEQIAQTLPTAFPGERVRHVVHETIYQALYVPARGELRRELTKMLRTGRARRKPHRRADARRAGGFADPMTSIDERPPIDDRLIPGHWEGDLITGEQNRSAIGTLVERTTRYVKLLHLPGEHTAVAVRDALIASMNELPPHLRLSLTWDQGKEMAKHRDITAATGMPVYFCDAHSPWQRGSNENMNGLLRQYFQKSTDLGIHTELDLAAVAAEVNGRPRKNLQWSNPADLLGTLQLPEI